MKGFCQMDLDMITRVREFVDRSRFDSSLSIEEKNDLHFAAGYLEGLKIRIECGLNDERRHQSSSHL